jgi:hypothetical protein
MDGAKQKRGVLLSFPSSRSEIPPKTTKRCPECERLEFAYETVIKEINSVVRGRFPSVEQKLMRLFDQQDVRDRALVVFYSHKKNLHSRKAA